MAEQDEIARAGYEVWRRSSPTPRRAWDRLRDHEREPWRRAAGEIGAEAIWRERYAGYTLPDWRSRSFPIRYRWGRIADAMERARTVRLRHAAAA